MDSPTPTRRDLKLASWEVVPTAGWLHLTRDTFLKSFLLDRGVSHLFIALADNFPAIAQMIQPLAAWALAAMGRFRRVVVLAFLLERLLVALPLLLAVALSWEKLPRWVLPAMATSYLVGSVAANGWLTWIGRLTDGQGRSAFLSRRSQREALTNAVLGPVAAAGLDWAIRHGRANLGYGAVFGVALMSGLISLLLIRRIDPATAPARDPNLPPLSRLLAPLRDPGYRRFLRFAGLLTIGQTLSHPFWTVYQLAVLHWTVLEVTLYNMAATLVAMAWYPVWGRLADRVGTTPLLRTLLLFRVVNPILWLFLTPDNAWWILAPEAMMTGLFASGVSPLMLSYALKGAPAEERGLYLGGYSATLGAAALVGALAGGWLTTRYEHLSLPWGAAGQFHLTAYHIAFLATALIRVAASFVLAGLREPGALSIRQIPHEFRAVWARRTAV